MNQRNDPLAVASRLLTDELGWNLRATKFIEDDKFFYVEIDANIPHNFKLGGNGMDNIIHIDKVATIKISKETNKIVEHTPSLEINFILQERVNIELTKILEENIELIEKKKAEIKNIKSIQARNLREVEIYKSYKIYMPIEKNEYFPMLIKLTVISPDNKITDELTSINELKQMIDDHIDYQQNQR